MKKIVICSNALPPRIGGIERHTFGLANFLGSQENVNVKVLCSDKESYSTVTDNFSIFSTGAHYINSRFPLPKLNIKKTLFLKKQIDESSLVIIQSHLFILNILLNNFTHF